MNQLQQEILKVYKEFKGLCDDHGLRFYAAFGTALGAVRHQGFIPWDDDVDVYMPYPDCLRLMDIINNSDTDLPVVMRNRCLDEDTLATIFKVSSKSNFYLEVPACQPKNFYGVFVDLFPLIGTPETETERDSFFREIVQLERDIYFNERYVVNTKGKEIQQLLDLFEAFDYDTSSRVASPQTNIRQRVFDREELDNLEEMVFEDTTIRIPKDYDTYLTKVYGDYMTLPDESERVGHHADKAYIDLENSHSLYTNEIEKSPINDYFAYLNSEVIKLKQEIFRKNKRIRSLEKPGFKRLAWFVLYGLHRKFPRFKFGMKRR